MGELGGVQSKTSETYKSYQKSERRIKELMFQRDEDKKNSDRITELAQKLQQKIKTYKKQKIGPEWLKEHYLLPVNPLDLCKMFGYHQPLFPNRNLRTDDSWVCPAIVTTRRCSSL